jgi:hypothetical protein
MKLQIKNKNDFIKNFLEPVSNINELGIFEVKEDLISCIIATNNVTLVCNGVYPVTVVDFVPSKLNVPDIKKLIRVLDIIPENEIELTIGSNNISYKKGEFKFKYHLLEDGIIKQPNLNPEKAKQLDFPSTFTCIEKDIALLFKASSFTTNTNKLYFYTEDDHVCGELGDKTKHNSDNFTCKLAESFTGSPIEPIVVDFEVFRLLSYQNTKHVKIDVNSDTGILICTLTKGETVLTYIVTTLIK